MRRFTWNMLGGAAGAAVGYVAAAFLHRSLDVTTWPQGQIGSSLLLMYAVGFLGYVVSDWYCKEVS